MTDIIAIALGCLWAACGWLALGIWIRLDQIRRGDTRPPAVDEEDE